MGNSGETARFQDRDTVLDGDDVPGRIGQPDGAATTRPEPTGNPSRQHREERRWRTDELRGGLATLAAAYRDRLVAATDPTPGAASPGGSADSRRLAAAVDSVEEAARVLIRNPNEALLLEALLSGLSGLGE